jgi:hypothetical protein
MSTEHGAVKRLRDRVINEPFTPIHESSDDKLIYEYIKRLVIHNIELSGKLESAEIELRHFR